MLLDIVPLKPDYAPDHFVNRQDEIGLVVRKVDAILSGRIEHDRVLVFNAPRGAGKSWLLRKLRAQLSENPLVSCQLIDLLAPREPSITPVAESISVLCQILKGLGKPASETTADRLREEIIAGFSQIPLKVIVLLVDHVDEAASRKNDFLEQLEKDLLGPLTSLPNVLLVLAGRGKKRAWRELKLRPKPITLQPFELEHTRAQLARNLLVPISTAEDIHRMSGGYPWATYLEARNRAGTPTDVIGSLLGEDANPFQQQFEAVCVVNSFEGEAIKQLFAVYFADSAWLNKDDAYYDGLIRSGWLPTQLVHWSNDFGGYVLDNSVRLVLENQFRSRDLELWSRLHRTAIHWYTERRVYPEVQIQADLQIKYHRAMLESGSPASSGESLSP